MLPQTPLPLEGMGSGLLSLLKWEGEITYQVPQLPVSLLFFCALEERDDGL